MVEVRTTLECKKCGKRWYRPFKNGDYVFKDTEEKCQKPDCDGKLTIEEVWAPNKEVPEKEKELLEKWS